MRERNVIDAVKAILLLNEGLSYREIGRLLAKECGRLMPYLGASVCHAISRHDSLRLKLR